MRIYRSKTERKSSVRFSWVQFSWVHLDQLRCSHTRLWQMKMKPLKSRPRSIPASHLRLLQRCWWISSEKQQYWRIWCDMINSFANPISDVCANNSHIKPVLCLQPCFPCSACSSGNSVLAPSHWLYLSLFIPSPGMTFSEWSWTTLWEMRCSTARWARLWTASIYGFAVEALFGNDHLIRRIMLGVIYRNAHGSPTRTISGSAGWRANMRWDSYILSQQVIL